MADLLTKSTKRGGFAMNLLIDLPERPYLIVQDRVWNKINKDAMRVALMHHHNEHMPRHFKRDARNRYRHKSRSEKYKAWKKRRFRSITDLVMTGGTRDKIAKSNGYDRITVGGAAAGGQKGLSGILVYTFGFNDKLIAHYLAKSVRFHSDPLAAKARKQNAPKSHKTNPSRVSLSDMRRELMAMTPDEIKKIAEVYRKEVFRAIEAIPQRRRRLKKQLTFAAFRAA